MEVMELLTQAVEQNAADIFLVPGMPFSYKIGGRIICQGEEKIMPDEMDQMITRIYEIAKNRSMERILAHGDDDFSFAIPGVSRFRANIFRQRGSLAAVIRVVRFELPDAGQLNLPDVIMGIAKLTRGMVLVTGPAGSGKSTTLACIIDEINKTAMPMLLRWKILLSIFTGTKRVLLPRERSQRIRTAMFQAFGLPCARHRM